MRIGIDAHMIGEHETGNESFIKGVVHALHQVDRVNQYYVFVQQKYQDILSYLERPGFQLVSLSSANALIRNVITLPRNVRKYELDALFATYTVPLFSYCPVVVAVHDLSYIHFPEFFPPRVRLQLSAMIPWSIRRAAHVTALSEFSKQDLIDQYNIPGEKITVTYLSVDDRFQPMERNLALAQIRQKYPVGERFILAVGNLQPRKNIPRLLKAFSQLHRSRQINHQLVVVGQDLWYAQNIYQAVQELSVDDKVIFTGYVDDEELPLLYNAADLFVYPSLFEGFGIPVLEAMRCGTPTVTSNTSSLPEVIGHSALSFDPYNVDAIADVIYSIVVDEERRKMLGKQCLQRSQVFSWEDTAKRLIRVFEGVTAMRHS